MKYRIVSGALASVNADCIVCPVGVCRLMQEVYRKAGEDKLRKDLDVRGEAKEGSVFATIGYDLPTGCILHVGIPVWADAHCDAYRILADLYSRVLITADMLGCESIALPVLAGCAPGYDITVVFRIAEEALRLFKSEKNLQEVYLVIRDPGAVEQLERYGFHVTLYEPCSRACGPKTNREEEQEKEELGSRMRCIEEYIASLEVQKRIETRTKEILARVSDDFPTEGTDRICT